MKKMFLTAFCAGVLFMSASTPVTASPVQVFECRFLVTVGPLPRDTVTGNFIIKRHITHADPFDITETDFWASAKFADEGYFEVTPEVIDAEVATVRSTSTLTTLVDGNEFIGDSYLDEAVTMEKEVNYEGFTFDGVIIALASANGSAIDSHLEVSGEMDREAWDPYPGCGPQGCPVECAVIFRVPDEPLHCGTPNNPNRFCETGSFVGRIWSVTHEPHEADHGDGGVDINAGMNDAWVSEEAPFQGLFLTYFPELGLMFLAWFTFDTEVPLSPDPAVFGAGDTRWVTAVGMVEGNSASLKAELTTGGRFNTSDPVPTQNKDYGSIDVEFSSCSEGKVSFDFPGVGESGMFTIRRVLESNVALCETLNSP